MAKEKEQKVARILFVEQGKSAKDIAELLNVTEATLSKWVTRGNWRGLRAARIGTPTVRTDNIKQIINQLTDDRIQYSQELKEAEHQQDAPLVMELFKRIAVIDDAVSKWNKTLTNIDKDSKISLSTYLQVMEMIFDELKKFDEALYVKILDFQEVHLNEVSLRFK